MYGSKLNLNEKTLEITGNTFPIKSNLKYWNCTYNPANKSWTLPESNKAEFISKFATETIEIKATETKKATNGLCPKCRSYCYGDCTAK